MCLYRTREQIKHSGRGANVRPELDAHRGVLRPFGGDDFGNVLAHVVTASEKVRQNNNLSVAQQHRGVNRVWNRGLRELQERAAHMREAAGDPACEPLSERRHLHIRRRPAAAMGNQEKSVCLSVAGAAHMRTLTENPKHGNVSAQDTRM
jgi:hypothetical protein